MLFSIHRKKNFLVTNKPLKILLLSNALIMMAEFMIGPIYALFVEEIGGNLLDASLAGAAFAITAGMTVIVSGRFSNKPKLGVNVMVAGYLIIGLGYFFYLFVHSIWALLLAQVIIGLGEAIYAPAFDGIYSLNLDHNQEGTEWGVWEALRYWVTAIGALLGGIIVFNFGFDTLFVVLSLFCFLSAVYVLFSKKTLLKH